MVEALDGCTKEEFLDCLELVRLFAAAVRRPRKIKTERMWHSAISYAYGALGTVLPRASFS